MSKSLLIYILILSGLVSSLSAFADDAAAYRFTFTQIEEILDENLGFAPPEVDSLLTTLRVEIDSVKDEEGFAYLNYLESKVYLEKRKLKESIAPLMKALAYYNQKGSALSRGKAYFLAGVIFEQGGLYNDAHEYLIKGLEQLSNTESNNYLGYTCFALARTSKKLGRDPKKYLNMAQGYMLENNDLRVKANYWNQKANLADANLLQLEYYKIASELYAQIGHKLNEFLTIVSCAAISYRIKNRDSMEYYIKVADSLLENYSIPKEFETNLFILKAGLALSKKNFILADSVIQRAESVAVLNGQDRFLIGIYMTKIVLAKRKRDYDKAFQFLSEKSLVEKSISDEGKILSALLVDAQYQDRERVKEIMALKYRMRWIVLISVIVLFTAISLLFYWRQKKNRNQHRQELELKKVLGKVHKEHEMVDNLQSQIGRLMRKEGGRLKESLSTIATKLEEIKIMDNEREEFLGVFDSFFEVAFKKLNKEYPVLTRTDCRYALLFALGLPGKTIAKLNGIQADSLRKIRQRLREKLELDSPEDLREFLHNLVSSRKIPRLAEFENNISILKLN